MKNTSTHSFIRISAAAQRLKQVKYCESVSNIIADIKLKFQFFSRGLYVASDHLWISTESFSFPYHHILSLFYSGTTLKAGMKCVINYIEKKKYISRQIYFINISPARCCC